MPKDAATRRGPWSPEEDNLLRELVREHGQTNWVRIAGFIKSRTAKQCRERWHQNLKPGLNLTPITPEEGQIIERMVREQGALWAAIARQLGNRSDNMVKNWWNGGQNRRKRTEQKTQQANRAALRSAGDREDSHVPQRQLPQQALPPLNLPYTSTQPYAPQIMDGQYASQTPYNTQAVSYQHQGAIPPYRTHPYPSSYYTHSMQQQPPSQSQTMQQQQQQQQQQQTHLRYADGRHYHQPTTLPSSQYGQQYPSIESQYHQRPSHNGTPSLTSDNSTPQVSPESSYDNAPFNSAAWPQSSYDHGDLTATKQTHDYSAYYSDPRISGARGGVVPTESSSKPSQQHLTGMKPYISQPSQHPDVVGSRAGRGPTAIGHLMN